MNTTSDNSNDAPEVPDPQDETMDQGESRDKGETEDQGENLDSGLDESRADDSYLAVTPEELLDVVNSYESRHQAAAASTDKLKRKVSGLNRRALQIDSRLSRVEREVVRGNLKVEGKNVPPAVRGENLHHA